MASINQAVRTIRTPKPALSVSQQAGLANSAAGFMRKLDARPGFHIPTTDWKKLSNPAQSVLQTFTNGWQHATFVAESYGDSPKLKPGDALKASELALALKNNIAAAGGGSKTPFEVLTAAARQRGLQPTTKDTLDGIAKGWKTRAQSPGWRAALLDVPPRAAQPEVVVLPKTGFADQARAEWYAELGTAYGRPSNSQMKGMVAGFDVIEIGAVNIVNAFSYPEWMQYRTEQLQRTAVSWR